MPNMSGNGITGGGSRATAASSVGGAQKKAGAVAPAFRLLCIFCKKAILASRRSRLGGDHRRSQDQCRGRVARARQARWSATRRGYGGSGFDGKGLRPPGAAGAARRPRARSEEHTSELPSLMRTSYAVFCLKKKTNPHSSPTQTAITKHIHEPERPLLISLQNN